MCQHQLSRCHGLSLTSKTTSISTKSQATMKYICCNSTSQTNQSSTTTHTHTHILPAITKTSEKHFTVTQMYVQYVSENTTSFTWAKVLHHGRIYVSNLPYGLQQHPSMLFGLELVLRVPAFINPLRPSSKPNQIHQCSDPPQILP